jgi:hypothetical protein
MVVEAVEGGGATRVGWRLGRSSSGLIEMAPHPDRPQKGAEEGVVEWYPPPDAGQLRGYHVSPWLQLPPPSSGQLWGATCPRNSGSHLPAQGSFRGAIGHGPEEGAVEWYPPPYSG